MKYFIITAEIGKFLSINSENAIGGYVCNKLFYDKSSVIENTVAKITGHKGFNFSFVSTDTPPYFIDSQNYYFETLLAVICDALHHICTHYKDVTEVTVIVRSQKRHTLGWLEEQGLLFKNDENIYKLYDSRLGLLIENLIKNDTKLKLNVPFNSIVTKTENEISVGFANTLLTALKNGQMEPTLTISTQTKIQIPIKTHALKKIRHMLYDNLCGSAAVYALDLASRETEDDVITNFFRTKIKSLFHNPEKDNDIANGLLQYMNNKIDKRSYNTSYFISLKKSALLLLEISNNDRSVYHLRIREKALFALVHLEAHTGADKLRDSWSQKHQNFIEHYGHNIYPEAFQRIKIIYETKLIAVQTLYFNQYFFEGILNEFQSFMEHYSLFINEITSHHYQLAKPDEFSARVYGTWGQAQAFLAASMNNFGSFEKAREYLLKDLEHCVQGSKNFKIANSYLHSLAWYTNDLNEAKRLLTNIIACGEKNIENIPTLIIKRFDELDEFTKLDCIRYITLLKPQNVPMQLVLLFEKFCLDNTLDYPSNLIAKWTSVLLVAKKKVERAIRLLKIADEAKHSGTGSELVFRTFSLINKALLFQLGVLPKKRVEVDFISLQKHPGFNEFTCAKKFPALHHIGKPDLVATAKYLPYYFS